MFLNIRFAVFSTFTYNQNENVITRVLTRIQELQHRYIILYAYLGKIENLPYNELRK